jgi:hypothetical protein
MSLRPDPIGEIPAETARVARAAFLKGTFAMRLREEFDVLYRDEDFRALYPSRGQPALAPWRLALVTIFQFLEHLSDRQAADAVRARIDWKFALGLELDLSRVPFQRAGRVPLSLGQGSGGAPAAGRHARAVQGARSGQAAGQAARPSARMCWAPCATCIFSN